MLLLGCKFTQYTRIQRTIDLQHEVHGLDVLLDNSNKNSVCKVCRCYLMSSLDQCTEWPQNNLDIYNVNATKIHALQVSLRVPNFNPFHSPAGLVWVTGHFETSAPNDTKWPWTLPGQTYPMILDPILFQTTQVPNCNLFLALRLDVCNISEMFDSRNWPQC